MNQANIYRAALHDIINALTHHEDHFADDADVAGWVVTRAMNALVSRQEQPASPAATVPDAKPEHRWDDDCERSYIQGWNDCRDEMIAAAPSPEGEGK